MSGHTLGPWYQGSHPVNCDVVYAARVDERVAECNGADEHEAAANARLVAAAPDLLEALRHLTRLAGGVPTGVTQDMKREALAMANAAIAKATTP